MFGSAFCSTLLHFPVPIGYSCIFIKPVYSWQIADFIRTSFAEKYNTTQVFSENIRHQKTETIFSVFSMFFFHQCVASLSWCSPLRAPFLVPVFLVYFSFLSFFSPVPEPLRHRLFLFSLLPSDAALPSSSFS